MKLTKKSLAEFLKANPNRRFLVGSELKCPIAGYFKSCGAKNVAVPGDGWPATFNSGCHSMPAWSAKFVEEVDNQGTKTITGKRALEILQGIGKKAID